MVEHLSPLHEPLGELDSDSNDASLELMWPLDIALAALGGLVIYTVVTRLDAADPRILYNPLTYAVLVPFGVVGLSLLLRNIASRFVRRSLQLGFLLSIGIHLMLLLAAFNWMILAPFWPQPTAGVQSVRAPLRKTVPDYLFTRSDRPQQQPDWSRPVDAKTTARKLLEPDRPLPPIEAVDTRLEMPRDEPRLESEDSPALTPRKFTETAPPMLSESAAELSRRMMSPPLEPQPITPVDVPELPAAATAAAATLERATARETPQASSTSGASLALLSRPSPTDLPQLSPEVTSPVPNVPAPRQRELPRLGVLADAPQPQLRRRREVRNSPAGATPATPTLSIARESPDAWRTFSERTAAIKPTNNSAGANLQPAASLGSGAPSDDLFEPASAVAPLTRAAQPLSGLPNVSAGGEALSTPQRRQVVGLDRVAPGVLGGPTVTVPQLGTNEGGQGNENGPATTADRDRLPADSAAEVAARSTSGVDAGALPAARNAPSLALDAPLGTGGLSADPARRIGFPLMDSVPQIASVDFGSRPRKRRDLGGPVAPAGSEVAGLRPFDRRSLRTSGAAAPTPAGMVGPQTEEAIERGLSYLAERQNRDGSWSLQGHGEEVLMQSDTAATGLCLLAFQGAGYTHKQHQYADTVARGIEFLVRIQRTNGDLYQRENKLSDRNAWLYSHGIASLALCEAYGMTRDLELRQPAQAAINFIAYSQDPRGGGWRYEPRVSSDTSVTGWMMMALKSGELAGLKVPERSYQGIEKWVNLAQEGTNQAARYRYNPLAPDTDEQRHGWNVTHTMTAVGLLARLYLGWERSRTEMQRGADYLAESPPAIGSRRDAQRDTYYWYYATQVMFHMGGDHWEQWNAKLNPILVSSQEKQGPNAGSWDPVAPVADRWARYAGRIYVTSMNLLSLEVYYRHLPIYEETAGAP